MYEPRYFGTPKPFGQHSTAYRTVGGVASVVRPASSMAVLISPVSETISEASVQNSPFVLGTGPSVATKAEFNRPNQLGFRNSKSSLTSQSGGGERWMQPDMPQKGRWNSSLAVFNSPTESKIFGQQTAASMQNTPRSPYQPIATEVPGLRQIPIQFEGQSSARRPLPERNVIPVRIEGASLTDVNPYHDEFQFPLNFSNVRRPNSAVPFSEYASRNVIPFGSGTDVRLEREEMQSRGIDQPMGVVANAASEASQFDRVQVFRGRQKPMDQSERHNYTSLHHIPVRPSFLQRRPSDPVAPSAAPPPVAASPTAEEFDAPVTNAMVNVAKNVREELEQDPKFRQRAESMGEHIRRAPTPSPHPPRQSPSLLQMDNYFSNLQRHQSAMELNRSVPLTSSAQPFNPDAVHNIFSGTESHKAAVSASNAPPDSSCSSNDSLSTATSFLSPHIRTVTVKTVCEPSRSALRKAPQSCLNGFNIQSQQVRSAPIPPPKPQMHVGGSSSGRDDGRSTTGEQAAESSIFKVRTTGRTESSEELNKNVVSSKEPTAAVLQQTVFISRPRSLKWSTADESSDAFTYAPTSPPVPQESPPCVRQYDDAVEEPLQRFLKLSCDIGGDLKMMGEKVSSAFTQQRNFIWNAAGQKEPSDAELPEKLAPLVKLLEEMATLKESKRNTPQFNHLSAVSEGIQALGWITVRPTPAPFVKDMNDASMFYVNRIRNEHKTGDKIHMEWTKAWVELLNSLHTYVRQVHTTGLVWNSNAGVCAPASAGRGGSPPSVSAPPTGGPAPPPPPPPPMLPPDLFSAPANSDNADRAALFAEINKGEDITRSLKKVTPDMQTHKNPALRTQGTPSGDITKGESKATPSTAKKEETAKPAKTWLENGKQWNVEYHKNNRNIIVEIGDMKQTVYVFKCENSVIQVKGKVNSITLDGCKKTSIVFDSLLSQIEMINCQGVQIQALGTMPTLSIQKTDGCQVYLSKESKNTEIVTSKSSEMNVLVPTDVDGDFMEFPVPEQFKTVFDGKKLQTTVSDIV